MSLAYPSVVNEQRINTKWIREVWVPALRSGSYDQGHLYLFPIPKDEEDHDNPTMCCLGVAVDCAIKGGILPGQWKPYKPPYDESLKPNRFIYGERTGNGDGETFLPLDMADFLGMGIGGAVEGFTYRTSTGWNEETLWRLNDSNSESFAYIASELERLCDWAEANGLVKEG